MHLPKTLASIITGIVLLAAAAAAYAQPPTYYSPQPAPYYNPNAAWQWGGWYLGADVGGTLMQDVNVRNANAKMAFEPGTRADFFIGYQIAPPLALEFETGATWNALREGDGLFLSSIAQHGDLYQVPILANLVYRVPLCANSWWYVGGGAGGVVSELDYHHSVFGLFRHASDTDFTFGFQGMTGLKFDIAPNMQIDVSYKFLGTTSHTWFDGDPILFTHTDPTYLHSLLASFTFRF